MTNTKEPNNKDKEKVTLGEEVFEAEPMIQDEEPIENKKSKKSDKNEMKELDEVYDDYGSSEVIDVEHVLVDDEGKKDKVRKPGRMKFYGILAAIVVIVAIFAEAIRAMIFKAEDSLLFLPKSGVFSPPVGVILIAIGTILTIIAFISLFNRRGKLSKQQKWISILIGLILVLLGVSTFFRFVDFRGNTIVDRTILTDTSYTYLEVVEVNAFVEQEGEGKTLYYNFKLQKSGSGSTKSYDVKITEKNKDDVKKIDSRISNPIRNNINSSAVDEMVKLKMYTRDEALKLFNFEE